MCAVLILRSVIRQQYIETLFEDMGVKSVRRDPGWFGLGFYFVT